MSTNLQDLRDSINPHQRKLLKALFFIVSGLAVLSCWIWYLLLDHKNILFVIFMGAYFYFCFIASDIRDVIMWPLYRHTEESE